MNNEDLRVTCDLCGGRNIEHHRKTPLPIRPIKLTEWASAIEEPQAEPAILRSIEMVAECRDCHFSVEYSRKGI
jgi:hypothetical protein